MLNIVLILLNRYLQTVLPDRPWQKVVCDLFHFKNCVYLLVVDYFSRWVELALLDRRTTSDAVIPHLNSMFAKFGIPEEFVSDGGPQFSSFTFRNFAKCYGFRHTFSSPRYPQSNGEAERAVRPSKVC